MSILKIKTDLVIDLLFSILGILVITSCFFQKKIIRELNETRLNKKLIVGSEPILIVKNKHIGVNRVLEVNVDSEIQPDFYELKICPKSNINSCQKIKLQFGIYIHHSLEPGDYDISVRGCFKDTTYCGPTAKATYTQTMQLNKEITTYIKEQQEITEEINKAIDEIYANMDTFITVPELKELIIENMATDKDKVLAYINSPLFIDFVLNKIEENNQNSNKEDEEIEILIESIEKEISDIKNNSTSRVIALSIGIPATTIGLSLAAASFTFDRLLNSAEPAYDKWSSSAQNTFNQVNKNVARIPNLIDKNITKGFQASLDVLSGIGGYQEYLTINEIFHQIDEKDAKKGIIHQSEVFEMKDGKRDLSKLLTDKNQKIYYSAIDSKYYKVKSITDAQHSMNISNENVLPLDGQKIEVIEYIKNNNNFIQTNNKVEFFLDSKYGYMFYKNSPFPLTVNTIPRLADITIQELHNRYLEVFQQPPDPEVFKKYNIDPKNVELEWGKGIRLYARSHIPGKVEIEPPKPWQNANNMGTYDIKLKIADNSWNPIDLITSGIQSKIHVAIFQGIYQTQVYEQMAKKQINKVGPLINTQIFDPKSMLDPMEGKKMFFNTKKISKTYRFRGLALALAGITTITLGTVLNLSSSSNEGLQKYRKLEERLLIKSKEKLRSLNELKSYLNQKNVYDPDKDYWIYFLHNSSQDATFRLKN